jgi:hypothetical protein
MVLTAFNIPLTTRSRRAESWVPRRYESRPRRWGVRECLRASFQSEGFKAVKAASARQDATFSMYEVVAR